MLPEKELVFISLYPWSSCLIGGLTSFLRKWNDVYNIQSSSKQSKTNPKQIQVVFLLKGANLLNLIPWTYTCQVWTQRKHFYGTEWNVIIS